MCPAAADTHSAAQGWPPTRDVQTGSGLRGSCSAPVLVRYPRFRSSETFHRTFETARRGWWGRGGGAGGPLERGGASEENERQHSAEDRNVHCNTSLGWWEAWV